jgi:hypothetical protein
LYAGWMAADLVAKEALAASRPPDASEQGRGRRFDPCHVKKFSPVRGCFFWYLTAL